MLTVTMLTKAPEVAELFDVLPRELVEGVENEIAAYLDAIVVAGELSAGAEKMLRFAVETPLGRRLLRLRLRAIAPSEVRLVQAGWDC